MFCFGFECMLYIPESTHAILTWTLHTLLTEQIEDGWWMGVKNGKVGAFPSNFVSEIFVTPKGSQR